MKEAIVIQSVWRVRRLRVWAATVLLIVGLLLLEILFPASRVVPAFDSRLGAATVLLAFLAALCCEFIDSALGMGYGTTLTPLLLLAGFEPLQIVPAVLLSECLTGFAAAALHHRDGNIDFLRDRTARRTALLLTLLSLVGSVAAVSIAVRISKIMLTLVIATMVLSVGILILATARRRLHYKPGHIVALGGLAAFNKALSGGGYGPLVTGGQVVSGVSTKSAVAITSLAESFTCLVGLGVYLLQNGHLQWSLAIPLSLGALMSVPVATLTVRRMPESFMRGGVGLVTCVLGALMLTKTLL